MHSPSMNAAIHRYFEVSLYLLVVTGFVSLASTGKLDLFGFAGVSLALILRGYLFARNLRLDLSERWASYITIAYVLFYGVDLFFISVNFVTATVHLVLFTLVVKLFSIRRQRDYVYLAVLAFLMVLAASVLTVDTLFLIAFWGFVLLAVPTFIAMEMHRSALAAAPAGQSATSSSLLARRFPRTLSTTATFLVFAILGGAAVLFFLLPRISAGYLSSLAPQNEVSTGFSDTVKLGQIGVIKQSSVVVMHIQIEGNASVLDLKWRGVSLARFDGRTWSNPPTSYLQRQGGEGILNLWRTQQQLRNLPPNDGAAPHRVLRYRVLLEPTTSSVLFLAPVPTAVAARDLAVDENGAVYSIDPGRWTGSYRAVSLLPEMPPRPLSRAAPVPGDIRSKYLQLPHSLDPRLAELARDITRNATTDASRAAAIEHYLKRNYGYTLVMATTPPPDPLAYFLFQRREGHCEYFASAMAILLRTLGVPSRVVNGFRTGEFNDVTGSYIIRGRDAHSWVEAYIPGWGWTEFDPTPPDPRFVASNWGRVLLYLDAMREFWREWVVNYDFLHQRTLTLSTADRVRRQSLRLRDASLSYYDRLLARARALAEAAGRRPHAWIFQALAIAGFVLLAINARRIATALHRAHLARRPHTAPQQAAAIWYTRMTHRLARLGYRKQPAQTPQEFAAAIHEPVLHGSVQRFTEEYERARFGDSPEAAAQLPELFEEIETR